MAGLVAWRGRVKALDEVGTVQMNCSCGRLLSLADVSADGYVTCRQCGLMHAVSTEVQASMRRAAGRPPAEAPGGGSPGVVVIVASAAAVTLVTATLLWAVLITGGSERAGRHQPHPSAGSALTDETDADLSRVPRTLSAEELFRHIRPAIVRIQCDKQEGGKTSTGCGFLVSGDGLVVTSNHVIEGADVLRVFSADQKELLRVGVGRAAPGTAPVAPGSPEIAILARDEEADLAILKIPPHLGPILRIASGPPPVIGTKVYAIGFPLGMNITFSEGLVSSLHEDEGAVQYIQTTAAFSPGTSGGPLVLPDGTVVGVAVGILSDKKRLAQNVNVAVPAAKVLPLIKRARAVAGRTQ